MYIYYFSTGSDVVTESNEHFSAWHRFLLLGALPSLAAAAVGFATLPESPRFLLAVGRDAEAIRVYQVNKTLVTYTSDCKYLLSLFYIKYNKFQSYDYHFC